MLTYSYSNFHKIKQGTIDVRLSSAVLVFQGPAGKTGPQNHRRGVGGQAGEFNESRV